MDYGRLMVVFRSDANAERNIICWKCDGD